jgi:hypothetical protein
MMMDKSTKTETGYEVVSVSKTIQRVAYSKYSRKGTKCASDGGTKNGHFWL